MYSTCQKPLGKPNKQNNQRRQCINHQNHWENKKKPKKPKLQDPCRSKQTWVLQFCFFCFFWFSQWFLIVYAVTSLVVLFFLVFPMVVYIFKLNCNLVRRRVRLHIPVAPPIFCNQGPHHATLPSRLSSIMPWRPPCSTATTG